MSKSASVKPVRALVVALMLAALAQSPAALASLASQVHFDIVAQQLPVALMRYSEQSGVQISSLGDLIEGKSSAGVVGTYSARDALEQLLQGTHLQFDVIDANTVAIRGVAASAALSTTLRLAQSVAAPQDGGKDSGEVGEVVVSGYRFLDEDTSGATNLPLPIEKVPQTISLVTSDFMQAANLKILGEVAQYTPGALYGGDGIGSGSYVKLRGFPSGSAVDGLSISPSEYQVASAVEPDAAIYERYEFVKGPSSVVYGTSSPGGLINKVTKHARPGTPEYLAVRAGSWNAYQLEGQAGGSLDADGRFNVIGVGVWQQSDDFKHVVNRDKLTLYGGFDAQPAPNVTIYVNGAYETFTRTAFDGVPPFADGRPAPVGRSFFIGSKNMEMDDTSVFLQAGLDWDITDLWRLQFKGRFGDGKRRGRAPYAYDLQDNGDMIIAIDNHLSKDRGYNLGLATFYDLDRLGLEESFVSVSVMAQQGKNRFWGGAPVFEGGSTEGIANLFEGEAAITQAFESAVFPDELSLNLTKHKRVTYSGQANLKIADPLTVLLGASLSSGEIDSIHENPIFDERSHFEVSNEVSYRGALTYAVAPGWNAYYSYSESFILQTSIDVSGHTLPPREGVQHEIGVKWKPPGQRLLVTGSVFQINENNIALFDQLIDSNIIFKPGGEQRHRGAELEVVGQLTDRWELRAGYAYLDPVLVEGEDPAAVGKRVPFLPQSTFSLFTTHSVTDRLTLGVGTIFVGSVKTSPAAETRDIPSYTVVDATAGYAAGNWNVHLNLHNLLDERYRINTWESLYFGNFEGTPRSASLTVRYTF